MSPRETLIQILMRQNGLLLLGKHKFGPFKGYYTGLIDSLQDNDHGCHDKAIQRIIKEQIHMNISKNWKFEKRAFFTFYSKESPSGCDEYEYVVDIDEFDHLLKKTSTLDLEWFAFDSIPYQDMPADDSLWYPRCLSGNNLTGVFYMDNQKNLVIFHKIIEQ